MHSGEQILSRRQTQQVNSIMATSGLYDEAGNFAYRVGLPGKSGVGGGILTIVPGIMGIAAFSPPLDPVGNSVRGQKMAAFVARELGYNLYKS